MHRLAAILTLCALSSAAAAQASEPERELPQTVTKAEIEDLSDQAAAERVFQSLPAAVELRSAVGSGEGDNRALALQAFSIRPYYDRGMCRYDRLLVWLDPPQGEPTVGEQDDPPSAVRGFQTDHYFADYPHPEGNYPSDTSDNVVPCELPLDDERFFTTDTLDNAITVKYVVRAMLAGLREEGPVYPFTCSVAYEGHQPICEDSSKLIREFRFRRALVATDGKSIELDSPFQQDKLIVEIAGTQVRSVRFIRPEEIIVTNAAAR